MVIKTKYRICTLTHKSFIIYLHLLSQALSTPFPQKMLLSNRNGSSESCITQQKQTHDEVKPMHLFCRTLRFHNQNKKALSCANRWDEMLLCTRECTDTLHTLLLHSLFICELFSIPTIKQVFN